MYQGPEGQLFPIGIYANLKIEYLRVILCLQHVVTVVTAPKRTVSDASASQARRWLSGIDA